jgi:hypothetical protein
MNPCTGRRNMAFCAAVVRGEVGHMGSLVTFVAVVLALALQPAFAQPPSAVTLPPGAQNPALAQPQMVSPLLPQQQQQPAAPQSGQTSNPPASSALTSPDGAGGLCECLINHDPNLPPYDKTKIHRSCTESPGACQAACNTEKYYSFVPHAVFSCPVQPGEPGAHVAMNLTRAVRLLSRR